MRIAAVFATSFPRISRAKVKVRRTVHTPGEHVQYHGPHGRIAQQIVEDCVQVVVGGEEMLALDVGLRAQARPPHTDGRPNPLVPDGIQREEVRPKVVMHRHHGRKPHPDGHNTTSRISQSFASRSLSLSTKKKVMRVRKMDSKVRGRTSSGFVTRLVPTINAPSPTRTARTGAGLGHPEWLHSVSLLSDQVNGPTRRVHSPLTGLNRPAFPTPEKKRAQGSEPLGSIAGLRPNKKTPPTPEGQRRLGLS